MSENPRKVLKVGLVNSLVCRDPHQTMDAVSQLVMSQVFEIPFRYDEGTQQSVPVLFAEPLCKEDDLTYSAAIRQGILFSDGAPLTVDGIVESINRVEPFREQAVASIDGERVRFRLNSPNARFDLMLTPAYNGIVREGPLGLVGTGPYVLAEGDAEVVRLVRNERYRSEVPIDEIVFTTYPTDDEGHRSALIAAVNDGEVDFTNALSRDDVRQVDAVRKSFQPGSSTTSLFLNTTRPHFRSVLVRRAVSCAIDRLELTKLCYDSALAFKASNLLPPVMGSWQDGHDFNPNRAQQLLEESGIELPSKLTLLTVWGARPYLPRPEEVAKALASQLEVLGVPVEVEMGANAEEYFERQGRGNFDMVLGGWIVDTADPADFLESMLSSELVPEPGKSGAKRGNMAHWSDPEVDRLLGEYRSDPNQSNQAKILKRVAEEVPLIPIMHGSTIAVTSWRVKNFTPVSIGFPNLSTADVSD